MDILHALILGAIQGLTEFLPISSSGHLILVPRFLGWEDQGLAFDTAIHLGTLLAVVWAFRTRILLFIKTVASSREEQALAKSIILATIPAGIAGLAFADVVESTLRSPLVVGASLILWGIVLWWVDRKNDATSSHAPTLRTWLFVGFAQALALIPGTSRSGITITAGLTQKISRAQAIELSFLLSIPIIAAAGISQIIDVGVASLLTAPMLLGILSAAISGFLAIRILEHIARTRSLAPFAYYRIALGAIVLFLFW
ncbi:MAG: undecaprenyl-diphosphate phosphatase [Patescibacteria group bacterium]